AQQGIQARTPGVVRAIAVAATRAAEVPPDVQVRPLKGEGREDGPRPARHARQGNDLRVGAAEVDVEEGAAQRRGAWRGHPRAVRVVEEPEVAPLDAPGLALVEPEAGAEAEAGEEFLVEVAAADDDGGAGRAGGDQRRGVGAVGVPVEEL